MWSQPNWCSVAVGASFIHSSKQEFKKMLEKKRQHYIFLEEKTSDFGLEQWDEITREGKVVEQTTKPERRAEINSEEAGKSMASALVQRIEDKAHCEKLVCPVKEWNFFCSPVILSCHILKIMITCVTYFQGSLQSYMQFLTHNYHFTPFSST